MKKLTAFDFEIYSHYRPSIIKSVWNKTVKHQDGIIAVIAFATVMGFVSILFLQLSINYLR
jgi:hypothetical protein